MERTREAEGSAHHYACTQTEAFVLRLVADGLSDEAIASKLGQTVISIHSTIRRFRERTGLAGRGLVVWAVQHRECCIAPPP